MSGEARAEAEALIAAGFRVWPISRRTLTPAKAGFARANGPDVCATAEDFTDSTEVGVLCGPCPAAGPGARFVCVDYDGPVPTGARVGGAPTLTSKNGAHAWYRVPPGVTGFRQTQSVRWGDGWAVDTRDFGGYARETKNGEPLWDEGPVAWPRDLTQAEVDALFGPAAATTPAEPRAATAPPTTRPSTEATNALATRWHTNPDGTNQLAGAVGAVLGGAWGWSDDQVREYFDTWLQHPDRRHLDSALRAAERYRAGERIYGFPKLAEWLGREFDAARPTYEDISAIILAADAGPAPPTPARFGGKLVERAADIATWDPPPVNWLVKDLVLAPGAPGLVSGYGGSGKTTFVQHLALAVATPGGRLFGRFPVRHGSVLHIDHEQGADLTKRRYLRLGLTAAADLDLVSLPAWSMADADARAELLQAARGRALVIIDSLLASTRLEDENASNARESLDWLTEASELTGAVFLVIHHSKKDRSDPMTSARGSSAITDAVSVHLTYEKPAHDERPVLRLGKTRHEVDGPRLADLEVRITPRGPPADGGYTLEVEEVDASTAGRVAQVETEIVALLATGWSGGAKELRTELKRKGEDVSTAIKQLKSAGTLESDGQGLRLSAPEKIKA